MVVTRGDRRRSTIYFVGVQHEGSREVRWVVKRPAPEAQRLGITPPMSAAEQFGALQRLHDALAELDGRFAAPRPVALLPDFDALAMEWVGGASVWDLAVPHALWRPRALREGVRSSALALRHLHAIEPAGTDVVDVVEVERGAFSDSREALRSVISSSPERWFGPGAAGSVSAEVVLLHGDWAPENVLLDEDRVFLLDPELTERGWPERDLARFLLMLWDRPLFVTTGALRLSALRRDLTRTFLRTYYGGRPASPLLRPMVVREVAQRWAVRHQDAHRGGEAARAARQLLLRRYFGGVLDEVSHPRWPERAVR